MSERNARTCIQRLGALAALALSALLCACGKTPMEVRDAQVLSLQEIENIVWTLESSRYAPLQLIFDETRFHGYDGCNWFGGRYEARGDSILPRDLGQTQRGCEVRTFPLQFLAEPFLLHITRRRLSLSTARGIFRFETEVAEPVENSPLLGEWVLTGTSDGELADLEAPQSIPALLLNEERGFRMTWHCSAESGDDCDDIFGLFGIGAKGRILFYATGWRTRGPEGEIVRRILDASSYRVEGDAARLILLDGERGTRFEFSARGGAGS